MDAVILAGGRGTRVRDLVPAFHKPLLPIDGVPLVCRAVDLAHAAGVEWPVIVVAPENAEPISNALGSERDVLMVVQRWPNGPGHALMIGLNMRPRPVGQERVLVLLSDNVSTVDDVAAVASHMTAVGVKTMPRSGEVNRFTRLENGDWIEKVPVFPAGDPVECWIGPFVGWRSNMENVLAVAYDERDRFGGGEMLIGPLLQSFMVHNKNVTVEVSSYDVGTLDAYLGSKS